MSLEQALYVASLNIPVFPVHPTSKVPYSNEDVANLAGVPVPQEGSGLGGLHLAQTDINTVYRWWSKWPDARVGIPTGRVSGITVLDLDVADGKNGFDTVNAKGWTTPGSIQPPSECSQSGKGAHYLFQAPDEYLGNVVNYGADETIPSTGVDRKGDGGYFLYCGADLTAPRPPVPEWFRGNGGYDRSNRDPGEPVLTLDEHEANRRMNEKIAAVRDSVSGERHDRLNSAAFFAGQMIKHFPEREEELRNALKAAITLHARELNSVNQAYQTIETGLKQGRNDSFDMFDPVAAFGATPPSVPAGAILAAPPLPMPQVDEFGNIVQAVHVEHAVGSVSGLDASPISDDEWSDTSALTPAQVVENLYYADVGVRVAPGGVGKTTVALYEAMCLATGRAVFGQAVVRPGVTCFLTSEDQRGMLVQRLRKICDAHGLSPEEMQMVRQRVRITYVEQLKLTKIQNDSVVISEATDLVINEFRPLHPSMIWIDPVVSFGVGENRVNDGEQGLIMAARKIRNAIPGCAIMMIHHSGKQNARDGTLDQYSGRGGSALADGSRMVQVMKAMTADEWIEATGNNLREGETAFVIARPKLSYSPPQGPLYVKRIGWRYDTFEAIQNVDEDGQEVSIPVGPTSVGAQNVGHLIARLTDEVLERKGIAKSGPVPLEIRVPRSLIVRIMSDRINGSASKANYGLEALRKPPKGGGPAFVRIISSGGGRHDVIASTRLMAWSRDEEYAEEFPEGVPEDVLDEIHVKEK